MSYFRYTQRDLDNAKREIGETLAGLADDSSRKLDDEDCDRQIVLEDLITRLCIIANEFAPGSIDLFESLANFRTPPIMDIVPIPESVRPQLSLVSNEPKE